MPKGYRRKKVKRVKPKKRPTKKRVKPKKRKSSKKGGAILGAAIWPGWGWLLPF